jgi:transcriptional regulator with XRE-family HTH domain
MMERRSRSTPLPALAAHRRRRGLTQRQLGELSGVAHTTVQQLESLKRSLPTDHAEACHCAEGGT